ncbi:ABC transporter substrate-binding protein [Roseibium litorale]|uniref:Carbohydrate ABC transporter substrate-binding protein n=1 Tax=Roseibium litorale TaxID=2803841 RepID=A0ABR9CJU9_9HYPH|nr:ABC transporter substrate-binding protein [Roseibium litorale]MBD8891113.1 carbohydrate ABC transporter substrate-binding protein [Roseibium litorale]
MTIRLFGCTAAIALMIGAAGAASAAELKFKPGEDPRFNWESYEAFKSTGSTGKKLTVFGPWLGPDKDLVENTLAYFEEATGIEVEYSGSDSFEQQIVIDTQAGSAPNIAVFPQPGLAADLASKGFLAPLGQETADWVKDNYAAGQSWVDLGTFAGKDGKKDLYGFFYKVDVKSLVWYSPDNFEDAGYDVPKTMEELKALTEKIVADGGTPWCIGLGSGGATGWPGTDWVEDMMLRTQTPEVYDKWVSNEIKFNDPRVVGAIEEFGWFANNPKFVDAPGAVAAQDFRDSPKGLFTSPPACYMHRQASFIPSFFPEGTEMGVDADFFYFPAYAGKDLGSPVLGAGTVFAITNDSPEARALIEFLKTPIAHEVWMAQSGFLTPHRGVNLDAYANDTLKGLGQILLNATTFRFDGSDLMPGAVGAGSFWSGMVDFVGGKSAQAVGDEIQASWDAIKK